MTTADLVRLVRRMDVAAKTIDGYPEGQELPDEFLAILDDVRQAAFRLAFQAQACIKIAQDVKREPP